MIHQNLETERLILRLASPADAEFFLRLYNSPGFLKYIGDRNLRTVQDAEDYIRTKFLPQMEMLGYGSFVLIKKFTGEKIGSVGIFVRDGLEVPDIGFSMLPEYEGKGFGFESANFLKAYAFHNLRFQKISAITTSENLASQNLIKKLGLMFIKTIRLPNDAQDFLYFEISRND